MSLGERSERANTCETPPNRHQQQVIAYLKEENQMLKSKVPGSRVRLTDTKRRRLAKLAHPLSRKELKGTAIIATRIPSCDSTEIPQGRQKNS